MNFRTSVLLPVFLFAGLLLNGCQNVPSPHLQTIKYDTRILWVGVENYVNRHPQMNHAQLSRITVADVVKSGQLDSHTVAGWAKKGFEVSIHPENFRAPGDGVVCQMNDRNSIVVATRTGEIKGSSQN